MYSAKTSRAPQWCLLAFALTIEASIRVGVEACVPLLRVSPWKSRSEAHKQVYRGLGQCLSHAPSPPRFIPRSPEALTEFTGIF
jgi:hypothetical protein